jgi:hypothetical protein
MALFTETVVLDGSGRAGWTNCGKNKEWSTIHFIYVLHQPSATVWGDGASVVPRSPHVVDAKETFPHWAAAGGLEETGHVSKLHGWIMAS